MSRSSNNVSKSYSKREPPIGLGNVVRPKGGGNNMLIVDVESDKVVAAWVDKHHRVQEKVYKRKDVVRVRDLW